MSICVTKVSLLSLRIMHFLSCGSTSEVIDIVVLSGQLGS